MSLEIAYLSFGISGIFGMVSAHYFFDAIKPQPKRFKVLDNLIALHNGLSECNSKGEVGSS